VHSSEQLQDCVAVSFSRGIRRIRNIEHFVGVQSVVSPFQAQFQGCDVAYVLVWGRKLNLPDSEFDENCRPDELAYAKQCRHLLVENDISKYNYCKPPPTELLNSDERALVVVLDQTRDDASVRYGAMDAHSFEKMLELAVSENPDARVVVRTHPDVVAGLKEGYLTNAATRLKLEVSSAADNPIPWLKKARSVYVGTSQLGYEALLCGCKVIVAVRLVHAVGSCMSVLIM